MAMNVDASTLTWYTLLDPSTEQFFYACPATGACSWLPPSSGSILQGHLPDWWEMYDQTTGRAYYFNNSTQETLWVLPQDLNVIPVPLSSEDDSKLRNVLGPPPANQDSSAPSFTTEEVFDMPEDSPPEIPSPKTENGGVVQTSPRRLANNEATKNEWVAMEDPRTGFNYYMNRKTMKLAWSRADMLHQEIQAFEEKQPVKVPTPQPVAFLAPKQTDSDFTTDSWTDSSVPVRLAAPALPGMASSSSTLTMETGKRNLARPKGAPPSIPGSPSPDMNRAASSSNASSTTSAYMENRKGSIAVVPLPEVLDQDPSIPKPPPAEIPQKKPYRASIFLRPLPAPRAPEPVAPKRPTPNGGSVKVSHGPAKASSPTPPAGSLKVSPTPTAPANPSPSAPTKPRSETGGSSVSRHAEDRRREASASHPEEPNGSSPSSEVINVAQLMPSFKRPVPASAKTSAGGPMMNSSSASSIPSSGPPSQPPIPTSVSMRFPMASSIDSRGGVGAPAIPKSPPSSKPSPLATAGPGSPPGSWSSRQLPPKPFSGPPPPVPSGMPPGSSRPPAHAPPNPAVVVTMDRGRVGSRADRISFRASISRVAPPTAAELFAEASQHGIPYKPPTVAPAGPMPRPPSSQPPKSPLRISHSANTLGPSTANPYAQSLPSIPSSGAAPATASKAAMNSRGTQRPALTKAFTVSNVPKPPGFQAGPPMIPADLKAQINFFQLEGFANQFFKNQKRGLFRRAVPIRDRLKWTQGSLKGPLLKLKPDLAKKALHIFKNTQICMGDRQLNTTQEERFKLMVEIFDLGLNIAALRDEIFCQLCKQTTLNPNKDSNLRGWQLIALFLQYFTPTKDLEHWFMDYCREYEKAAEDPSILTYVRYSLRILLRPTQSGSTLRVPEVDEVELALRNPAMPRLFGVTLEAVLENQKLQRCAEVNARPDFPYIITSLISIVTKLGGPRTEGIFRIPGSHKLCTKLRLQLEAGDYSGEGILDPHVPASVLKWWLRDLEEPLIPANFYNACITAAKSPTPETSCPAVIDTLPPLNRTIVYTIIKFVQVLAKPENAAQTKMAVGSLAIVFGPNLLRCQATEMMLVFEAQKWEQTFVVSLVKHLKCE